MFGGVMSFLAHGVIKSVFSVAALTFLGSNSAPPDPLSLPPRDIPGVVRQDLPTVAPPAPAIITPSDTADNFRQSYLRRVASNSATIFNKCFGSSAGGYSPSAVNTVRAGNAQEARPMRAVMRDVDYNAAPVIVLDAGHGHEARGTPYGYDTGAVRDRLKETEVVDAVAKRLRVTLQREIGADVVETRGPIAEGIDIKNAYRFSDQKVALQWRSELSYKLANEYPSRPVLFLSLHANTASSPRASGAEVFYYNGTGQEPSRSFARNLAAHYRTAGGVRLMAADFGVLRCQKQETPSVLLELGFLSSPADRALLRSAVNNGPKAEELAMKITKGVDAFLQEQREKHTPHAPTLVASVATPSTAIR